MANIYETPTEQTNTSSGSSRYEAQIAHQDSVIAALTQRLTEVQLQRGYSFSVRQDEYAIERKLAAAHDERGALVHDRNARPSS